MSFAVLHVPAFALQAILRSVAGLAAHPVALSRLDEPAVEHCSRAAHAAGVRPGQSLPQALARCPALIIHPPSPDLEKEAEGMLLAVAFSVCPQVELTSPGTCTLDLRGLAPARHRAGLQPALLELREAGFEAGAGLGATPLLAYYTACQAEPHQVLAGDAALLAPLPVAVAGPTPEQAGILQQWGIKTLGQLTALTKADITHRLGRAGLALWERASGGTTRPLVLRTLPEKFEAGDDCEHELETLEPLLFLFRRYVDRLALELRNASLAAQGLKLTLKLSDETAHEHFIRLPEPVADAALLFRALHTYLETVRTEAGIVGVRLLIAPGRSLVRQRGLFDGGLVDPHGFADTLARVMALVGSDRVGTPVRADTHRPDTFKLATPPATLEPLPQTFTHPPRGLPLRRHRPPLPANIALEHGRPAFLWADGLQDAIRACDGPWHASGDWWEAGRAWQREEWDIELESGSLHRLVRVPKQGWFLEGEYD